MLQFRGPIHGTPIGDVVVLPPADYDIDRYWPCDDALAVGDEAEVVERAPGFMSWDPPSIGWRRVALVRLVRVLPITSSDEVPPRQTHVTTGSGPDCVVWKYDEPVNDFYPIGIIDLPTAEPGGLVAVLERIESIVTDAPREAAQR